MKEEFIKKLSNIFFIRLHMSIIMLVTFLSGMLFSKLSYNLGWTALTSRYLISFLFSYGAFIGSIRLWLWYIFKEAPDNNTDLSDIEFLDLWLVRQSHTPAKYSGDGSFSGGGASGSFKDDEGIFESVSKIGDADDAAPIFLIVGIVLFILVLVFGGFYLILEAPMFLGEIAFDLALTLGVVKSKNRKEHPVSWLEGIAKKTFIPAAIICVIIFTLGFTENGRKAPDFRHGYIRPGILPNTLNNYLDLRISVCYI